MSNKKSAGLSKWIAVYDTPTQIRIMDVAEKKNPITEKKLSDSIVYGVPESIRTTGPFLRSFQFNLYVRSFLVLKCMILFTYTIHNSSIKYYPKPAFSEHDYTGISQNLFDDNVVDD